MLYLKLERLREARALRDKLVEESTTKSKQGLLILSSKDIFLLYKIIFNLHQIYFMNSYLFNQKYSII